ncbi:MAG: type I phosphomannose isomerase catalytic subunit [Candidatus Promineifilaceae bacterium]
MTELYPLLFEPALKDYVWGGHNLERLFGRRLPPGITAESWEISAHPNGESAVLNGPFAGLTLSQLHRRLGLDLIGRNSQWAQDRGKFPLLIKLLDANKRLSVQVHPTDDYARAHENDELGKTEMWVVLHAEPGASLILGVKAGTTPEAFRQAVEADNLEPLLHMLQIKAGDFICVPSGSLHAILGGAVLSEIQQNSDVTYRVYDWGRHEPGRPLHIEKALDVINFDQVEPALPAAYPLPGSDGVSRERLCDNNYFTTERWSMSPGSAFDGRCDGSTFEIWGVIAGEVAATGGAMVVSLPAVTFTLLPASLGEFQITADKPTTLLRIFVRS